MTRISQKLVPEISTEYFCKPVERNGEILQTNIHNSKGEPIYEGIAIVDYGNCSSEHCQFVLIEEVKENTRAEFIEEVKARIASLERQQKEYIKRLGHEDATLRSWIEGWEMTLKNEKKKLLEEVSS